MAGKNGNFISLVIKWGYEQSVPDVDKSFDEAVEHAKAEFTGSVTGEMLTRAQEAWNKEFTTCENCGKGTSTLISVDGTLLCQDCADRAK